MSAANEAVVTRWVEELLNKQDATVADEILAVDMVLRDPITPLVQQGRAAYVELVQSFWAFAPDFTMTILEQFSAGDRVILRWVFAGTHQGEFAGQAPTGRGFEVEGISILRLADGQICEEIVQWDGLGLSRQLGISLI